MGFGTSSTDYKTNSEASVWCWISNLRKKWITNVVETYSLAKKIAKDDWRRVVHSFKVGLALTLVSMLYYVRPLYDSFGDSAMWAVMTVVVVFEYTVGATLGKGLNRAAATLLAGGLGIGVYQLATLGGEIGEPILIGFFVYIFAAIATFIRFFPKIKARYDYGFLIFILTFSLVAISGYRASEVIEVAHKRLTTIAIGVCITLLVNTLICPVWAGEELHNSIALNMEKLGHFLEGFGSVYLTKSVEGEANCKDVNESAFQGYKSILNSKSTEETMANFARWEPGHGQFGYLHPWKQYIKLGSLIRQCAYRVDTLNTYLKTDLQKQEKFLEEIRESCTKISLESSKTLKKLGTCLKSMKHPSSTSVNAHIVSSKAAVKSLKTFLKTNSSSYIISHDSADILQIIPIATVSSLLIEIVDCTEKIAECAYDLATLAHFDMVKVQESVITVEEKPKSKNNNLHEAAAEKQDSSRVANCPEVVITVAELSLVTDQNSAQAKSEGQHCMV